MTETLRTNYSVRQICDTLGFHRSGLYYEPKSDPSDDVLRSEIETLSARYPRYGYRRMTRLLLGLGYTVGYRRVARLMKEAHLSVAVERICRTRRSFEGTPPWVNRVENLDIRRCDQVWVGDITYVRLKKRFIYVCVLMDFFTCIIRSWQVSHPVEHISDPESVRTGIIPKRARDTSF